MARYLLLFVFVFCLTACKDPKKEQISEAVHAFIGETACCPCRFFAGSDYGKGYGLHRYVGPADKNFGLCGFVGVFSVQDGIGGMVSPSPRDGKREHKRSFGVYCSFS